MDNDLLGTMIYLSSYPLETYTLCLLLNDKVSVSLSHLRNPRVRESINTKRAYDTLEMLHWIHRCTVDEITIEGKKNCSRKASWLLKCNSSVTILTLKVLEYSSYECIYIYIVKVLSRYKYPCTRTYARNEFHQNRRRGVMFFFPRQKSTQGFCSMHLRLTTCFFLSCLSRYFSIKNFKIACTYGSEFSSGHKNIMQPALEYYSWS